MKQEKQLIHTALTTTEEIKHNKRMLELISHKEIEKRSYLKIHMKKYRKEA